MEEFDYNDIAKTCSYAGISRTARHITQIFDRALQPSGLSSGQFTILLALAVADNISIKPLAQRLLMDRTTLTRNLKLLQREKWVEITSGDDHRQRIIKLTVEGNKVLRRAIPLWRTAQEAVVSHLGFNHWQVLMNHLDHLVLLEGKKFL